MPTYSYACTECDNKFDLVQAFSDDALTECPQCDGRLRKLFGKVGVVFKGSGFYRTDSREAAKSTSNGVCEEQLRVRELHVGLVGEEVGLLEVGQLRLEFGRNPTAARAPRPRPPRRPADPRSYPQAVLTARHVGRCCCLAWRHGGITQSVGVEPAHP